VSPRDPYDPRRGDRRLGVDRRWSREDTEPDRRFGTPDRRAFQRRDVDVPESRLKRLLRRWFFPNRRTD
jgi:hypothetical protein